MTRTVATRYGRKNKNSVASNGKNCILNEKKLLFFVGLIARDKHEEFIKKMSN